MNSEPLLDQPDLREALKRCSPATYYAACQFRQTGAPEHLHAVIVGVIERFVDRELRAKLEQPQPSLLLREDLALDSLTMMEIVMLAEEVLPVSVTNEELTRLRTLGEVQAFFAHKLHESRVPVPPVHSAPPAPALPGVTAS